MAYAVAGKTQINAKGAYCDPAFDVLWFRATCKGTVLISRIRYFFTEIVLTSGFSTIKFKYVITQYLYVHLLKKYGIKILDISRKY